MERRYLSYPRWLQKISTANNQIFKNIVTLILVSQFLQSFNLVTTTGELKLMTYNIRAAFIDHDTHKWDNRKSNLVKIITDNKPDVLGTQEANRMQINYLETELAKAGYDHFGAQASPDNVEYSKDLNLGTNSGQVFTHDQNLARAYWPEQNGGLTFTPGGDESEYTKIFYNSKRLDLIKGDSKEIVWLDTPPSAPKDYSIFNIKLYDWAKDWKKSAPYRIYSLAHFEEKSTKKKFWVLNTHLSEHTADHERQVEKIKSDLKKYTKLEGPIFIMGDFNAGLEFVRESFSSPTYRLTMDSALKRSEPINCENSICTHRDWGKSQKDYFDFIIVYDDKVIIKDHQIVVAGTGAGSLDSGKDTRPSDHYPVVATVTF